MEVVIKTARLQRLSSLLHKLPVLNKLIHELAKRHLV